ncbi:probable G-protein coupled receptor No18 [Parasteatoda tepidariorum]|uniref:probable G-protein coupled receptor No18 n=1 Tax=Parasteatoda tepidariorum TaxID=114398 RepID=UPI00077FA7B4|nr:5-hydroxytryptamine receptor 1D-like [Parasteatoda tepidariorum]
MSSPTPTTPLDEYPTNLSLLDISLIVILTIIILITILGNTLIITAVATTRRLRTVTNYFVVSLAASDLLVGLLVMPFAVVKEVTDGLWLFGQVACELWVSLDVMLCTASILNLCCISLDRYFAITQPLAYAVKRSVRLALIMIGIVWLVSAVITCPPMFGWHDRGTNQNDTQCAYIADQGYVVYSALGSFYIPAFIMVYVYWRIFAVARKRQAVLMQGTGGSANAKDGHGSDSNSSTLGDNSVPTDHQRMLKEQGRQDSAPTEETTLPLSQVRGSSTRSSSGRRRSSFSLIRSSAFFLHRQNTYNPNVTTKLYHQQNHEHHHEEKDYQQQQPTENDNPHPLVSRNKSQEDPDQGSNYNYHCQYCNPKKESQKPTRLTIRKKDGYERAAFQRERRVAKSLSVVVGGFIICWLPFFTVYLIEPFCQSCVFHPTLTACLVWLGWVNSAINPFIYALNNNDFKKAFLRLTIDKCGCCRKTRKGHDPQQFI